MKKLVVIFIVFFVFIVVGCSNDCDKQMDNVRKKMGAPEEVTVYDSRSYHSYSWWYWSKGKSWTFEWGSDFACKVSTFMFDPITKSWKLEYIENCSCSPIM